MKIETKKKILYHKTYFDFGYGESSYIKYLIAVFGVTSNVLKETMIIFFTYGVLCYVFGYLAYKHNWVKARTEIGNEHNLFVNEMRKEIKSISGANLCHAEKRKIRKKNN